MDLDKNNDKWTSLLIKIKELFAELELVKQPFHKPWYFELRNALLEKRKNDNYISLHEIMKLTTHNKITSKDKKSAFDFFTKIGLVTYFSEEILDDVIFLNPKWITQNLCNAINAENEDGEIKGLFTKEWIYDFWEVHENGKNYLLRLMLKDRFNICFKLKNGTFVLPFLRQIPKDKPDGINWEDDTNNIKFRIECFSNPYDILCLLTVRLNELIELNDAGEKLIWKEGVILKNDVKSRANIACFYDEKSGSNYIDIRIKGTSSNSQKELLQLVRIKLKEIRENSIEKVDYKEQVCCNCDECKMSKEPHYFDMTTIENHLDKKRRTITCRLTSQLNIDELISPVYLGVDIKELMSKKETNLEKQEVTTKNKHLPALFVFLIFLVIIGTLFFAINHLGPLKGIIFGILLILLSIIVFSFGLVFLGFMKGDTFKNIVIQLLDTLPKLVEWLFKKRKK